MRAFGYLAVLIAMCLFHVSRVIGYERTIYNLTLSRISNSFWDTYPTRIYLEVSGKRLVAFGDQGRIVFWDLNKTALHKIVFVENTSVKNLFHSEGSLNLFFVVNSRLKLLRLDTFEVEKREIVKTSGIKEITSLIEFQKQRRILVAVKDNYLLDCRLGEKVCAKIYKDEKNNEPINSIISLDDEDNIVLTKMNNNHQELFLANLKNLSESESISLPNCSVNKFTLLRKSEILWNCNQNKHEFVVFSVKENRITWKILDLDRPGEVVDLVREADDASKSITVYENRVPTKFLRLLDWNQGNYSENISWTTQPKGFSVGKKETMLNNEGNSLVTNESREVSVFKNDGKPFWDLISFSQKFGKIFYLPDPSSYGKKLRALDLGTFKQSDLKKLQNTEVISFFLEEDGEPAIYYLEKKPGLKRFNLNNEGVDEILKGKALDTVFPIGRNDLLLVAYIQTANEDPYDVSQSKEGNFTLWNMNKKVYSGRLIKARLIEQQTLVVLFDRSAEIFDKQGNKLNSITFNYEVTCGAILKNGLLILGDQAGNVSTYQNEKLEKEIRACSSSVKDLIHFISDKNDFAAVLCSDGHLKIYNVLNHTHLTTEINLNSYHRSTDVHKVFHWQETAQLVVVEKNSFTVTLWNIESRVYQCLVDRCEKCNPQNNSLCKICQAGLFSQKKSPNSQDFSACLPCDNSKGYVLDEKNVCRICENLIASCRICEDKRKCSVCKSGFFKYTIAHENRVNCTNCAERQGLLRSKGPSDGTGECLKCEEMFKNCKKCSDNQKEGCFLCENGYYLKRTEFIYNECDKCDSDRFYITEDNYCSECYLALGHCKICDKNGKVCQQCHDGFFLQNDSCTECSGPSSVKNKESGICEECSIKFMNCEKCSGDPAKCEDCAETFYLDPGSEKCEKCSEKYGPECLKCNIKECMAFFGLSNHENMKMIFGAFIVTLILLIGGYWQYNKKKKKAEPLEELRRDFPLNKGLKIVEKEEEYIPPPKNKKKKKFNKSDMGFIGEEFQDIEPYEKMKEEEYIRPDYEEEKN